MSEAAERIAIRDRVKHLRRMRAGDLVPHERNWRTHPREQRQALEALLADVGFAGAIIGWEMPDGRIGIIDGHLRSDLDPDAVLPVLVTDLDADEAAALLLTYDPIGTMATAEPERLAALLSEIEIDGADVLTGMLRGLAADARREAEAQDGKCTCPRCQHQFEVER